MAVINDYGILKISLGSFSIIGLLIIIYCYFYLVENRKCFEYKLIVFLSLATLINNLSIVFYLGKDENSSYCNFTAFTMLFFDLCSVSCGTTISLYLLLSTKKCFSDDCITNFIYIFYLCFSIVIPLGFGSIYFIYDAFGFNEYYCRINPDSEHKIFVIVSTIYIFIQIMINTIFSLILFITNSSNDKNDRLYVNTILGYSLTFLVCWFPLTITRLWNSFMMDESYETTGYQILFFTSFHIYLLQGVVYLIILMFQAKFWEAFKFHITYEGLFGKWFICGNAKEQNITIFLEENGPINVFTD